MERKYSISYEGVKFDVVEVKSDLDMDYQMSVLGDPGFTKKRFEEYSDPELEAQGYELVSLVNGSLFFSEGVNSYANGIEKAYGVIHENDDAAWDGNQGFYIQEGLPYMFKQGYIKSIINRPEIRGAKTAAFGLVNNGLQDISGAYSGQPSRGIYLAKSGRVIVGKKSDNTLVFAVCDGVTGSSGLTGYQTYKFARWVLGLRNAVCEDGGGSTFGMYRGVIFNDSPREGVNAVAIYGKRRIDIRAGDKVTINGIFTVAGVTNGKTAFIDELSVFVDVKYLKRV